MIDSNRTIYFPQYRSHCTRTFPKDGKTKIQDFNSKQVLNSGGLPNHSNLCFNNYLSASIYNVRTRKGHLDVIIHSLDG